jgi:hypothetical protein
MITSTALAIDNGFRVVVVLTADNVALVRQTADRFKSLGGPRVLSAATEGDEYEWEGRIDELRDDLPDVGIVLVCAKSAYHLPHIVRLLRDLNAATYPAVVFDDEADTATPDTTLAARSSGRPNAPSVASTINRQVVENTVPGEIGESILQALPHRVFIQVTATPYVLVLQRPDSALRPGPVHLLEPGAGYQGGEAFFGDYDPTATLPGTPLVIVSNTEATALQAARLEAPSGLAASIAFFLVAGAAHVMGRAATNRQFPAGGYKHLAHTSVRMAEHDHVVDVISNHVHGIRRALRDGTLDEKRRIFLSAYEELRRSEAELTAEGMRFPPLDELVAFIDENLPQAEIIKVNAKTGEPRYGPTFNFIVGGNILGRGITIDDLLVTYYLRQAVTSQMDTVWQHGRMFGYRAYLMPYTRVYLPRRLAATFKGIHNAEEDLREVLRAESRGEPIPISVISGGRATRTNALERDAIKVYKPGTQVFPRFVVSDRNVIGTSNEAIRDILLGAGVPLDESVRERRFVEAPLDVLIELARLVPIRDDDDGRWDTDAVVAVLENVRVAYDGRGRLYARGFERDDDARLRTGVLSGPEVNMARTFRRPVLALLYRGAPSAVENWYPTLFLPDGMPIQVFNADP